MKAVISTSSPHKSVRFIDNGLEVTVHVLQDGDFWFAVGDGFATMHEAVSEAKKALLWLGYTLNDDELAKLS